MRPYRIRCRCAYRRRADRLAGRQPRCRGAKQTVENLRLQLDEVVKERDVNREARRPELAALEASQVEREKGFEARIRELIEAKEALSTQFAEISNKLLAEAQETFLKRADQRFRQSEENAGNKSEGAAPARSRSARALRDDGPEGRGRAPRCIRPADRARSRRCARVPSAFPPRPPSSSTRFATRPRRADAGASSSFATCSKAAACPSIATSRPKSAWRTARAAACGPTSSSGFRAASRW